MGSSKRTPSCLGIIICDHVYQVAHSDRTILVGVMHGLTASAFPFRYPAMQTYLTLTGGQGSYDLSVSIENAQTGMTIVDRRLQVHLRDPLEMMDVVSNLANVVFPQPGKYWADVKVDGQLVAQRPLFVGTSVSSPGNAP